MTPHVTLPGSARTLAPRSRAIGAVDPTQIASLTLRTRSIGDVAALEERVRAQSALPLAERQYLTREDLAKSHGASPADLDLVERVAHQHNLTVVHRSAAERSIVLRGRIGDLLNAFPADVQLYDHPGGAYRGRRGEIMLPSALDGIVTGVFGYDTRPKRRSRAARSAVAMAGPGGGNGVPSTTFAQRYAFPTTEGGHPLDGSGQTVAIIELGGGFRASDLRVYFHEIGVATPQVTAVSVDHAGNKPSTPDSADGEVMLDIEVAGAVAPGARFAVYFAPNNGNQGFIDAISAAIHDTERSPSIVSISWGSPESSNEAQAIQAFHELFVAAASLGVTVCVATGDHGVADLDGQSWDGQIHVDHPAVDPMVLACGGTQIEGGMDVVWNDGTPFGDDTDGGGGWTTGGGISTIFPVPDYQTKLTTLPVSLASGKPGRGIPDLAMSATNYFTRVDTSEGAAGGTSAVAPLTAALVALLNQAKGKTVGFLNPWLYANPGVFVDVVTGDNGIAGSIRGYSAGPGWDACSGLGTPKGGDILAGL
jgi:kumamolisin